MTGANLSRYNNTRKGELKGNFKIDSVCLLKPPRPAVLRRGYNAVRKTILVKITMHESSETELVRAASWCLFNDAVRYL